MLSGARNLVAIVVVALGAALFAIAFREAVALVFEHVYDAPNVLIAIATVPLAARWIVPAVGGAIAGFVSDRSKGGHGVGDVMEAVVLGRGFLSVVATAWKALGTFVALVTGGSIGREGPLIQFGAGLGALTGKLFGVGGDRTRALVLAGAAAGFAAAYNTPIAGVLFVVEVVAGVVALDALLPAFIATPIATAVTRWVVGGGPIYGEQTFAIVSDYELGGYFLLGLAAALVGFGFMALLGAAERGFAKIRGPRALRAGIGGLLVGAMVLGLPEVSGNGYEAINQVLEGGVALWMIALLLPAKAIATACSVGSGAPGGVFTPALALGASLGGLFGHAAAAIAPGDVGPAGAYVLVGMAAVCAATTHAPLMAAVLVFELSGDYAIVLPLLVATGAATYVSRRLREDSIYDAELRRRGFAWDVTLAGRRFYDPAADPGGG